MEGNKFVYQIGYWSFGESPERLLYHDKKLTKNEFQEICSKAFYECWESQKEFPGLSCKPCDLIVGAIDILIGKYGFVLKDEEKEVSFRPFGWENLLGEEECEKDPKDMDFIYLKKYFEEKSL